MSDSSLLTLLAEAVRRHPDSTASDLCAHLRARGRARVTKHDINPLLYSNARIFRHDGGEKPRWRHAPPQARTGRASLIPPSPAGAVLYPWQARALGAWEANGFRGAVEAVTGAGKTRVGLEAAVGELRCGGDVLVLVPTLELLKQWHDKLLEHAPPGTRINRLGGGDRANFRTSEVIVATVQSIRKRDDLRPWRGRGLLVADECHRYGSECNKDALDERFRRRLGLSATYARNDDGSANWLDPYFGGVCFSLNYAAALREGVIAHFTCALVGVRFSGVEMAEYEKYSETFRRLKNELVNKHGVTEEPFGEFIKQVEALSKESRYERATAAARTFLHVFAKRRKLLAETPAKADGLRGLAEAIRCANRTLIFSQTIAAAERAVRALEVLDIHAGVVHSRMHPDERKAAMEMFASGHLKVIVAPQVLDEGVDVPEADLAIILAASKTRRQMIQRMGRVLRVKGDERLARFALLYVEGTSEDPAQGAHGDFIEEITGVADEWRTFGACATARQITEFLCEIYAR